MFDAAIAVKKYNTEAYHAWGEMDAKMGYHETAMDLYIKGLRNAKAKTNFKALTYCYSSLGKLCQHFSTMEESMSWFSKGVKIQMGAQSYVLWLDWAIMEAKRRSNLLLIRHLFDRALTINSKDRYVYLSAASFERRNGNTNVARDLFDRGAKLNPGDATIFQTRALLEYVHYNNPKRGNSLFRRASRINYLNPKIRKIWAIAEWKHRMLNDRAREIFEIAIRNSHPSQDWANLFHSWASMEIEEGNFTMARDKTRS